MATSLTELNAVAKQMLDFIEVHKIVAIEGKMGAGKTTLIKSFCDALGVAETMSSPTFSLVNEYTDAEGDSIFHFDFYRIKKLEENLPISNFLIKNVKAGGNRLSTKEIKSVKFMKSRS